MKVNQRFGISNDINFYIFAYIKKNFILNEVFNYVYERELEKGKRGEREISKPK